MTFVCYATTAICNRLCPNGRIRYFQRTLRIVASYAATVKLYSSPDSTSALRYRVGIDGHERQRDNRE
jgi:hypothetical protein